MSIKYVHTNIIASNWRKLSQFYIDVFNCKPVYPKRDLSGKWIDKMTNIKNVNIKGIHLRLPGYEDGPTLEIFEYRPTKQQDNHEHKINDHGFCHLAFHVDVVEDVLNKVLLN